ncbi:DUF262 domain-containing protein [Bradyrhizobium sp. 193]|uniref:DUF262 domain-containing protein n=1 Tax=unclassified Bradyrhizobium TaxID=2631580 RepID=UPI001FFBC283|nr:MULTISPECIES: DUF262 domain-containing protein [unclassified Bradyrhizobium]MCK1466868.1 DUF262 domain-containing protein [Bradyrhizobium sp. CW10]MCK1481202.1 DUF262 domain-containing protein [Bradyrhizobium sp. 193]
MDLNVGDLVQRFDTGEIRLPIMQRDYVWKPKKVVELLDSLYRGWPIGSFYVWQTTDDQASRKRAGGAIPARRMDGFYGFLLDGQQRLTSLSLSIRNESNGSLSERAFFDLENEKFYLGAMRKTLAKRIDANDPLIVSLSDLIPTSRDEEAGVFKRMEQIVVSLREQKKLGPGNRNEGLYRERLHKIAGLYKRKALCEEFPDEEEENAFQLFRRLNKGGTSLSAGDVEAARLASAATKKILEPMRAVAAERDMRSLGVNFIFLLRCLVTVHRGNCSFSKLPKSWAEDTGEIESSWRATERSLRAAVEFVRSEIGWTTRRWLPSANALIPVVYLLAKSGKMSLKGKDAALVRKYLLVSGLRGLFRSSTETTVNSYVNAVLKTKGDLSKSCKALFDRIPNNRLYKIRKDEVRNATNLYSSLMQVYFAYLYAIDAKSWPSGRSLRNILHEKLPIDPLAVHHIFPKKFMQDFDFPIERLNTASNYAVLSQADNAELGDRDPFDVWRTLKTNQRECASQQLFFVGKDDLLRREAYEEFIDFRAEKIAEKLNEFLELGAT